MKSDEELVRIERLLINISASAKRWWTGGLAFGLLGGLAIYNGVVAEEGGSALLGAVLLAVAIVGSLDGYCWSRVGRYLELRGIAGQRDEPGGRSVEPGR